MRQCAVWTRRLYGSQWRCGVRVQLGCGGDRRLARQSQLRADRARLADPGCAGLQRGAAQARCLRATTTDVRRGRLAREDEEPAAGRELRRIATATERDVPEDATDVRSVRLRRLQCT